MFSSNSSEFASFSPSTSLANSTTAICIPKHIPKNGILFSLAYFIVAILPSIPLFPNPPGTKSASYLPSFSFALLSFISSESTKSISTFTLFANPACLKLSATERYESSNATYFPTIATFTGPASICLIWSIIACHSSFLGSTLSKFKHLHTSLVSPSSSSISGTAYKLSTVLF